MRLVFYIQLITFVFFTTTALAFKTDAGTDGGNCADCHILGQEEAREIFKDIQGEILSVDLAAVPGLWRIEMRTEERVIPLYLDFSKTYLISGNVIRLSDRKNLTEERLRELNPINPAMIPTEDTLLLGNPEAENRIIVFTDPGSASCSKMHQTIKQAAAQRPDLLFLIKLMPIKQSSLKASRTITCNHSLELLEEAFSGKALPESDCNTPALEQTLTLARDLGIRKAPTLILPDGQILSGYRDLVGLLELIDQTPDNPGQQIETEQQN